MTSGVRPSGRARRGFRLAACRTVVAAGTALAWLWPAPAQASSTATSSPVNLLQGDQATFSKSTATWSNYSNAALQWSPTGQGSSGGLAITATGPKMAVLSGTTANGGLTPANPGSIYSAAISAESTSDHQVIQTVLLFYTGTGAANARVFGPGTSVQDSGWATSAPVVGIAPVNTASVALGVIVYNAGAGSQLILDNAWIEQTAEATTPAVVGPLSTSGNRILQANGAQFVPRGVVLNGLETKPAATTVTQQAVIQAKAWGANIIRLPLGEQFWLSSNCDYWPGYQAEVDQVVNWITSLGMVALLDLHTNTVLGCQAGSPHNMADEAQSPAFWSQVAARYGSNPLVAFDLYNEPHDISNQVWMNGGMTIDHYAPFLPYRAAGMQQLYNSVRSAGAENLVIASGLNWADDPPSQPLSGTNIVYAVHDYTCLDAPPPSCSSPSPYDPSSILNHWVSFSSSEPVAITEFGWPSQSDGTYARNLISQANSLGWGWIAFAWEDAPYPAPFDITEGWSPNSPAQPSPSGIPVLCELVLVSTGATPCAAPQITSSTAPKTQTVSPVAPGGGSIPKATAAPAQHPAIVASPQAVLRTLGVRPFRPPGGACAVACENAAAPVPAVFNHQATVEVPGHSASTSPWFPLRVASLFAALGIFILLPISRRLGKTTPASA